MVSKCNLIYPWSLAIGITIVLISFSFFDYLKDKNSAYLVGLIVMWLSCLLTYWVFLRRENNVR